jgi:hypothetical protein
MRTGEYETSEFDMMSGEEKTEERGDRKRSQGNSNQEGRISASAQRGNLARLKVKS